MELLSKQKFVHDLPRKIISAIMKDGFHVYFHEGYFIAYRNELFDRSPLVLKSENLLSLGEKVRKYRCVSLR